MGQTAEARILEAAEELFAERGFAATSTRMLAERAGVNEVTLFRIFGTKAGVLRELFLQLGADQVRRQAQPEASAGPPRETLTALAVREVETSVRHGGVALRVAFEARSVPEIAEMLGEGPAENLRALAGLFERWQSQGLVRTDLDPRVLAEAFSALTSSYVIYRQVMGLQPAPDLPQDEAVRQLVEVFLGGVLTQATPIRQEQR